MTLAEQYFGIVLSSAPEVERLDDGYVEPDGLVRPQGYVRMVLRVPDSTRTRILEEWRRRPGALPDTGRIARMLRDLFPGATGIGLAEFGRGPQNYRVVLADQQQRLHLFQMQISDEF